MIGALAIVAAAWNAPVLAQEVTATTTAGVQPAETGGADDANAAEPNSEEDNGTDSTGGDEQEEAPEDVDLRDRSELGPGKRLSGTIDLSANWTDNFFYAPQNKQSVVGWFLSPSLTYDVASPRFLSNTTVGSNIGFYSLSGTADDYRDLYAGTNAKWSVGQAHRLGYDIQIRSGHDPFGLMRTESDGTVGRSLDRWVDEKYIIEYRLGQPLSSFSLENRAKVTNRTYHTNREPQNGFGTKFLDNDVESFETTGLYHYSPKTHLQLNFLTAHVNFDKDFPARGSRDAQEYRLRGGLRWVATVKTTGDFRIGYMTRQFERANRKNISKFDWLVSVDWSPLTRTSVLLQTGRQSIESYNEALYIDVTYVRATWRQEWSTRLTSSAALGYSNADFVNLDRRDHSYNLSLRADYRLMPKVSVYAGYDLDSRTSGARVERRFFDYDKNTLYVGVRAYY